MLFKTTVLALLESHPKLYQQLRLSRRLMQEMNRHATDLRTEHQELSKMHPQDSALELATAEIESRIASEAARLEVQPSST